MPLLRPCFPLASVIWQPQWPLMPLPHHEELPAWGHALTRDEDLVAALKILEPALHLLTLAGYEVPELVIRVAPAGKAAPALSAAIAWNLEEMSVAKGSASPITGLSSTLGFLLRRRATALALPLSKSSGFATALGKAKQVWTGDHVDDGWIFLPVTDTTATRWAVALHVAVNALVAVLQPRIATENPNTSAASAPADIADYTGLTQLLRARMWVASPDPDRPLPEPWLALDAAIAQSIDALDFGALLDREVGAARTSATEGLVYETSDTDLDLEAFPEQTALGQIVAGNPDVLLARLLVTDLVQQVWVDLSLSEVGLESDVAELFPDTLFERLSLVQLLLFAHDLGVIDVLGGGRWAPTPLGQLVERLVVATPWAYRAYARQSIPLILTECARLGATSAPKVAYILATAQHEAHLGAPRSASHPPMVEYANRFWYSSKDKLWHATTHLHATAVSGATVEALELSYWDTCYPAAATAADARDFRGRGFVQLTWRDNYRKFTGLLRGEGYTYELDGVTWGTTANPIDLEVHFDHVNRSLPLAARILVTGMIRGSFYGNNTLDDYMPDGAAPDYVNARDIINGDKNTVEEKQVLTNGQRIANIAETYATILERDGAWAAIAPSLVAG